MPRIDLPGPLGHSLVATSSEVDQGAAGLQRTAAAHRVTASQAVTAPSTDEQRRYQGLHAKVTTIFERHFTADNRAEFETLIENRSRILCAKGESADSLEALLSKAQRMDRVSSFLAGAARSAPAGLALYAASKLASASVEAASEQSGGLLNTLAITATEMAGEKVFKHVTSPMRWTLAMNKATANTQWLHANEAQQAPTITWNKAHLTVDISHHGSELEDVMKAELYANQPSTARKFLEQGVSLPSYPLRDITRTLVAPIAKAALGETTAAQLDLTIKYAGMLAGQGAASLALGEIAQVTKRSGAEYFLARKDWESQFDALKAASWGSQAQGLGLRTLKMPLNILVDDLATLQPKALLASAGELLGDVQEVANSAAEYVGQATPAVGGLSRAVAAPAISGLTALGGVTGQAANTLRDTLKQAGRSESPASVDKFV